MTSCRGGCRSSWHSTSRHPQVISNRAYPRSSSGCSGWRWLARLVLHYEAASLRQVETNVASASDAAVLISVQDAAALRARVPAADIRAIAIAAKVGRVRAQLAPGPVRFIFVGTDALRQNQLTIDFLLDLWRRERVRTPLVIYGQQHRRHDLPTHVSMPGYADDLDDIYDGRSVLISPSFVAAASRPRFSRHSHTARRSSATQSRSRRSRYPGDYPLLIEDEGQLLARLRQPDRFRHEFSRAIGIGLDVVREHHDPGVDPGGLGPGCRRCDCAAALNGRAMSGKPIVFPMRLLCRWPRNCGVAGQCEVDAAPFYRDLVRDGMKLRSAENADTSSRSNREREPKEIGETHMASARSVSSVTRTVGFALLAAGAWVASSAALATEAPAGTIVQSKSNDTVTKSEPGGTSRGSKAGNSARSPRVKSRYRVELGVTPRYISNLFRSAGQLQHRDHADAEEGRFHRDAFSQGRVRSVAGKGVDADSGNARATKHLQGPAGRELDGPRRGPHLQCAAQPSAGQLFVRTPRRLVSVVAGGNVYGETNGFSAEYVRRLSHRWQARGSYQFAHETFSKFKERDLSVHRLSGDVRYRISPYLTPRPGSEEYERGEAESENFSYRRPAIFAVATSEIGKVAYLSVRYRISRRTYLTDVPTNSNFGREDHRRDISSYANVKLGKGFSIGIREPHL